MAEIKRPKRITVDAKALHALITALNSSPMRVSELMLGRADPENPINVLIKEYNDEVRRLNPIEQEGLNNGSTATPPSK